MPVFTYIKAPFCGEPYSHRGRRTCCWHHNQNCELVLIKLQTCRFPFLTHFKVFTFGTHLFHYISHLLHVQMVLTCLKRPKADMFSCSLTELCPWSFPLWHKVSKAELIAPLVLSKCLIPRTKVLKTRVSHGQKSSYYQISDARLILIKHHFNLCIYFWRTDLLLSKQ